MGPARAARVRAEADAVAARQTLNIETNAAARADAETDRSHGASWPADATTSEVDELLVGSREIAELPSRWGII